jgi:hypothetical protein
MTTTQRLKESLRTYLATVNPAPDDITVVDAKQRAEITLPTLAIDVPSAEPHSVSLAHVQRCDVEIVLRCHAGDESDADIDAWIDQLESALNDPTSIKSILDDGIRMDHWLYQGSTQEWDESMLEVTFSAQCLVTRI